MNRQVIGKINNWKETFIGLTMKSRQKDLSVSSKWWEIVDGFETGNMIPLAIATATNKWGSFTNEESAVLNALPYCRDLIVFILNLDIPNPHIMVTTEADDKIYFLIEQKGKTCVFEIYIQTKEPVDFDSDIFIYMMRRSAVLCVEYITEKPQRVIDFFGDINEASPVTEDAECADGKE